MRCRKSFFFLAFALLLYLADIVYAGLSVSPISSDLAVVLGNEVLANGEPSDRLKARLDCAVKLYREHLAPLIMVSGGKGKSGYDEATVMAEYLKQKNIPTADIIIDSEGINTMATAINTARIADMKHFKHIVIVSQYYHLPRCILAFRRAGLTQLSSDYPRYLEAGDIIAVLREGIALPDYFIKMPQKR